MIRQASQARGDMTSRQRMLAALGGQEVDRLPFWAKVTNPTWLSGQPEKVRAWSAVELLDYILADGIFGSPSCVRQSSPRVTVEHSQSANVRTTVTHTPDGDLTERWTQDPATRSWHPTEFPVKDVSDLKRFGWLYEDVKIEADDAQIDKARQQREGIAERGVMITGWGTSPLMHLVEHVIGPVNTSLMLFDHPREMDEIIARHCAADAVVSVENTSTTLISPRQFERYCLPHLKDYGRAIQAEGKMHELHMCGHTKALLPQIDTIPAASIEAFTSPTLGNTRLVDGRTLAPSKTLIGGTNVNVWLWEERRIERYILEELAACPNHRRIVLTTAGVAPPGCPAETFRRVGQWIPTVPIRM